MGWAKYDEDNRDAIEERLASTGHIISSVFNYTSDYTSTRVNMHRSRCRTKISARALAAYYAAHYDIQEQKEQ